MTSTSTRTKATGEVERVPFFLVLQQLGRRVLRPGGAAATRRLLATLAVGPRDDVIELAAGVGTTAQRLLATNPKSYLAVEPEDRFAAQLDAVVASAGGLGVALYEHPWIGEWPGRYRSRWCADRSGIGERGPSGGRR